MTSNRKRVLKILSDAMFGNPYSAPEVRLEQAVLDLAAERLIMPDLPAPSRTMFPGGRVWYIDGPVGDVRATNTGKVMAFGTSQEQPFRIVSTPGEARTLARTLEAAADHAEKAADHVGKTLGDTDD